MQFLIIHQLYDPTPQAIAAQAALMQHMQQHDPAVKKSDAMLTSSQLQQQVPVARIHLRQGQLPEVVESPAAGSAQDAPPVSSFMLIDVADHTAALAWAQQWPAGQADSMIEVRATGCPGGVSCVSGSIPAPLAGQQADSYENQQHFMVVIHEEPPSATAPPQAVLDAMLDAMQRHNIESVEAGIMLAGHGLHLSAEGKRVAFKAGKSSVIDGPFSESKELIAGYWLIQVPSRDAAIEWARNYPYPVMNQASISVLPVLGLAQAASTANPAV